MKKIYIVFYMVLFLLLSNLGYAQLTIVKAVAVDGDSNGFYGTVEIEFSTGVNDSEMQTSALPRNDWDFSMDPEFSTFLRPDGFDTEVSAIAIANVANDKYVRLTFSSEFASSNGPIYFRYTNGNPGSDDVTDFATGTDVLADFTLKSATDEAPPVIASVESNATGAGVLKVGESIIFTVDFEDNQNDPNITILPAQYNGENLNWVTFDGGDSYTGTYTVTEGNTDRPTAWQLIGVTAIDEYSNESASFNGTNIQKTIDANTPVTSNFTATTIETGSILNVGDSVVFSIDISDAKETDVLTRISPSTFNGESLNWRTLDSITFKGNYTIAENNTELTSIQLTGVSYTDLAGNESSVVSSPVISKSIDSDTPVISSVTSDATGGGTLTVGETITFTVDIATADGSLSITPLTYNSKALTWLTNDGGDTYKGIYTISEGDDDQKVSYLDLSGVTATDPSGNESNSKDGVVTKYIDANTPVISNFTATTSETGSILNVGDSVVFSIDISDAKETDVLTRISPSTFNGESLNWRTLDSVTFKGNYTIAENNTELTSIQLTGVSYTDLAGNESSAVSSLVISKSIDSKKLGVTSVFFTPGDGTTVGYGETVRIDITALNSEAGLTANTFTINAKSVTLNDDGDGTYYGIYNVGSGDTPIGDGTRLPFEIILTDGNNIADSYSQASLASDASPGVDPGVPSISDVSFYPGAGEVAIVGDTIFMTITASESSLSFDVLTVNSHNIIASLVDSTVGKYGAYYVVLTGDTPLSDGTKLPYSISISDGANDVSYTQGNFGDKAQGIDPITPVISGLTASTTELGSVLNIGDKVDFAMTISDALEAGVLSRIVPTTFNEEMITWSTSNNINFTAVYEVKENNTELSLIQLTGVKYTDIAGNESSPASSTVLAKSIDSKKLGVTSVFFTHGNGTTVGDGETVRIDITALNSEAGLTANTFTVNAKSIALNDNGDGTYYGIYTVGSGDSPIGDGTRLPFTIILTDGYNISDSYTQASLASDVSPGVDPGVPSISDVSFYPGAGEVAIVGDTIFMTITASESSLSFDVLTVNSHNIIASLVDSTAGKYGAYYVVLTGDTPLSDGTKLPYSISISDGANDVSYTQGDFVDKAPGIDIGIPVITDFIVTPVTMIKGQTYTAIINVNSDTDIYSMVSGELSGFTLHTLTKNSDTEYSVQFTISDLGFNILESSSYLLKNLVLADGAGNLSSVFSKTITQAGDPIYTKDPEAEVTGEYYTCDKDTTGLVMQLTGNAPWEVELSNGTGTTIISGISKSPYTYKIKAVDGNGSISVDTMVYKITKVTDNLSFFTNYSDADSAIVYIKNVPIVDITSPPGDQSYNVNADADTLVGSPLNGVFSGDGIVPSNNTFFPSSAGLGLHDIVYTYTDPVLGCSNSDTAEFNVIESDAEVIFQDNRTWRCDYETTFTVTGSVIGKPGIIGTFSLDRDNAAISSSGSNIAQIDVQQLSAGTYVLSYNYFDGVDVTVTNSFTVESVNTDIGIPVINNYCEDYDTIFIEAENITPLGGDGIFTFSGNSNHYVNYGLSNNKLFFIPDSIDPGDYNLQYYYTTPNGCNSLVTSRDFTINGLPTVNIIMDALYNINGGTKIISGTPAIPAGSFDPSYMIDNSDGTANFNPEFAGIGIDTANYTYTDANGCTSSDMAIFEVDQPNGFFNGIDKFNSSNQYCYYNGLIDTISVTILNGDGTPGKFYIDGVEYTGVVGQDSIAFLPSDLLAGDHDLTFTYTRSGVEFSLDTVFNIDSIGDLNIVGIDSEYCEDDDRDISLSGISDGLGSGSGLFSGSGIVNISGKFNPSLANVGINPITYTYIRENSGCVKDYSTNVTINKIPDIGFSLEKACISGSQDSVIFEADTLLSDIVVNWSWSVTASGISRFSNEVSPKFSLVQQEKNFIALTLETDKGCTSTKDSSIFIGSVVDLDFSWDKECFGETVTFDVLMKTDELGVDSVKWNFGGDGVSDLTDIYKPQFTYASAGGYDVVYMEYTKNCGIVDKSLKINIRPSVKVSNGAYFEDFEQESDVTGWAVDLQQSTSNSTWVWGTPSGSLINSAAGGSGAFVTNLDGNYANDEKSILSSPCFDLSSLERPMISFDFISALQTNRDGIVLEYTTGIEDWKILGFADKGVNWFNTSANYDAVLGSSRAWTGDGEDLTLDNVEWRNAKYWLEDVLGEAGVRFRFKLGTDDTGVNEGFAFDNLRIGERDRTVLIEHFANTAEDEFKETQLNLVNILAENSKDAVAIQYFTSYPEANDIGDFYAAGPSARSLYYGVAQVPYSILDGGDRKFNYTSTNQLSSSNIKERMLESSDFSISVQQEVQGSVLQVSSTVKSKVNISNLGVIARIAVVEKNIINGTDTISNVLRAMLPDPAGKLIEREWLEDDSVIVYQTWQIPDGVSADSLMTIVFIQDEDNDEIYQVGYTDIFTTVTSIDDDNVNNESYYSVYPNPTTDRFTIGINKLQNSDIDVSLYNSIGVLVKSDVLQSGDLTKEIHMDDLPLGVYYLELKSNNIIHSKKIVKSN